MKTVRLTTRLIIVLTAFLTICNTTFAQEEDKYFTTSDGVKLHYRVAGKGTPLVILPGYGQAASTFDKLYDALKDNFTIYTLDYRWVGKSDSPAYGYHIERLATDAKEMIEHVGLKKFYLFGHSMGNAVSWGYFSIYGQDAGHGFYDSHPEIFKSLALDFLKNY